MTHPVRLIFLGTPHLATIPLRALHAMPGVDIVAVITQPDRPSGRGRQLTPPPVKVVAQELGIATILQPETLKDDAVVAQIATLAPDIGVVAAYGEILRKNVLAIPTHGYLNIHPSLLPRHRGPAPVTSAILAGDHEVGVSVMQLGSKMDAGPILVQHRQPLTADDRAGALTDALFHVGARLLCDVLRPYIAGTLVPTPQDDTQATYIGLLSRDDGRIDWTQPASQIARLNRAYDPWPGTYTTVVENGSAKRLKIFPPTRISNTPLKPAEVSCDEGKLMVGCSDGSLELTTVQPEGGKRMSATEYLRGKKPGRFA